MSKEMVDKIETLAKANGKTLKEIGKESGVGENAIYRWETGLSYPSSYYLPLIADRFHCSIDYLFGRD